MFERSLYDVEKSCQVTSGLFASLLSCKSRLLANFVGFESGSRNCYNESVFKQ